MTFWPYFIKDYDKISVEKNQRSKLLVGCLCILLFLELASFGLALIGFEIAKLNVSGIITIIGVLVFFRISGDETISFLVILALGVFIIIFETMITGGIYSFNIKWFFVFAILVSFMKPKLLIPYAILLMALYVGIYSFTQTDLTGREDEKLAEIILIDHIFFVLIFCGLMVILDSFRATVRHNLENSNSLLEKRTDELNSRNVELQRFSHVISHDLKTHLRSITSFSSLLENRLNGHLDEKTQEYIHFIKGGTYKLNSLVEDINDFNDLSENPIRISNQNLNEIIADVQKSLQSYVNSQNAVITVYDNLPQILGSRFYCFILFKNLIINGIKFNNSSTPSISISSEIGDTSYTVIVEDNGIGIPENYQDQVFDMFSKLHTDQIYTGSGLGLALCKKIMLNMKGDIRVDGNSDKGTKIHLRFPVLEEIV